MKRLVVTLTIAVLTNNVSAWYQPKQGRWLSRDPLGDGSFRRQYTEGMSVQEKRFFASRALMPAYLYVANNPVSLFDPLGLDFVNKCTKDLWVLKEGKWIKVPPGEKVAGETDAVSEGPDADGKCRAFKWIDCYDASGSCDGNGNLQDPALTHVGNKHTKGKPLKRKICCAFEKLADDQQKKRGGWKDPNTEFGSAPPGCD